MLASKSDYKQIRDTMFGDGPRIAIDENVLGSREQKRIKRNVDQYYLKEIKSLYETTNLDNSLEFSYPIDINEPLLTPNLGLYADLSKFQALKTDVQDMWKYTGGEDPDIDSLRNKYEDLTQQHIETLSTLLDEKDTNLSNLYDALSTDILANENELSTLEATLSTLYKEHDEDVAKQLSDYQDDLSSLDERKNEIDKQKQEGSIELSVWAQQRQDLEKQYYELDLDNIQENNSIDSKFYGKLAEYYVEHYDLVLEGNRIQTKYDEDVATELSSYSKKLSSENYSYNTEANSIYLDSNGYTGKMFHENRDKLNEDIAQLSVYVAHENVNKAIPWISAKDQTRYIEYNDRLFADWENCKLLKAGLVGFHKDVEGVMEHYTSYQNYDSYEGPEGVTVPGWTARASFDRWIPGDMVAFKYEYQPTEGAGQSSTIKIISQTFTARFGNRHQLDKVKKLYLILQANGSGEEDGHGTIYKMIEAKFDKVICQDWLKKIDDEDDLNLKNIQKIEDDYNEDASDLRFEQAEEEYQLKIDYEKDIREIEESLERQIRTRTTAFISGIESTMIQANSLKVKGEDNSALIDQINQQKTNYMNDVSNLRTQANDRKNELNEKYREDIRKIIRKYSDLHQSLTDDWKEAKDQEGERHAEARSKIMDDYTEDFNSKSDAIWDKYDEAVEKANQKQREGWDKIDEENAQFDRNMVDSWNDKFKDEPDFEDTWEVSEDYSFMSNGVPIWSTEGSDINKWIANSVWLPIETRKISNGQRSDALADEKNTSIAAAAQAKAEDLGKLESLSETARYAFTFSGASFADFIEEFDPKPIWSEIGEASVDGIGLVAAFAEMDYGANTGKEYKDYEELDNPEEDEEESND